jgi:putative CocE/NonD family hydrolase
MRKRLGPAVALLSILPGGLGGPPLAFGQAGSHEVAVETNVMVPMRDGVRLATDIYRPARAGRPLREPLPALLYRTPYDKTGRSRVTQARYFASHGYVVGLQDLRGRFASEGTFTKYIGEGRDGYDAIEWLARHPAVNGEVGMWGTSYAAHVQANAAKLRPPSLATIVLNMGGMYNGWDHKIRNHGAFEHQQLTWAFRHLQAETSDPLIREMLQGVSVADWFQALPLRRGLNPLSVAPNFEDYILEMMLHTDYDDYWKHLDINWQEHFEGTADIPMLLVSGWYDSYAGGTVKNYVGLSRIKSSPVRLIMGAWTHGGNTRSYAGELEFGAEAALTDFYDGFHLDWFDHFLKGKANGVGDQPAVRIFVMGTGNGERDAEGRLRHGGYWRSESSWPLPDTRSTPFYFHADGSLSTEPPAPGVAPTVYTYDPDDPVPTIGGAFSSTSPLFEPGAYDQREREDTYGARPPYLPLKARSDVLCFQTAPLEEAVEVIGPITVELHVSSTAPDTDFTAKLVDVYPASEDYPAGFELNLTDGISRARYRNSPERQEMMLPGQVYEILVEPFPTANVFKKGHRIRVDISSSNFPRFDVNPNTGEPLGRERRRLSADNAVYHEASRPSRVVLPIVPRGFEAKNDQ